MKLRSVALASVVALTMVARGGGLQEDFVSPPESARPWVYWMFMDGNLTREGMTADLEAMKAAGIGGTIFLEVDIGIPRGPVKFMSPEWRGLVAHAVHEAERLGLQFALGAGPGWCGSGGPWVKPEQSMQHLVASETNATGPARFEAMLPRPPPRKPYFGEGTLTPELRKQWLEFYRDVAVIAFPTPAAGARIADVDEKTLYFREPYSSKAGVKPFLPAPAVFPATPPEQCVASDRIVDLTDKLTADGRLVWDVPPGNWTIQRFGRTTTGQTTRPAPQPGLGFESDKFDRAAVDAHFESFVGMLLKEIGPRRRSDTGLTTLHFDSWEMSSQNWSEKFRDEFRTRRGYDPLPFLPAMTGRIVGNNEISERFLWDLRETAQELVIENHATRLKELGRKNDLELSIEPYDLNPTSDLRLGGVADVPMCEFWSKGYGFSTEFSCFEAVSIAHTMGRNIVGAESFTSSGDGWKQHPASMKAQADWALCCGINRFVFHRYQHQPWLDRSPGMTFGPYGVNWERTQTWWKMAPAFHTYLARCQTMLRRGLPVADILYLAGEGAPHVFRPPRSALRGDLPDRRGYSFDGCAPQALMERASVKKGRIVFPDGMSYRVLVLPRVETMTPALLKKIKDLAADGATIIGSPSQKSPSLVDYPKCDVEVKKLAAEIWGGGHKHVIPDAGAGSTAESRASSLANAKWIWYPEGNPAASAPVSSRSFRKEFVIASNRKIVSAKAAITADNSFELRINGQVVSTGDNFHETFTTDVAAMLKPGTNALDVLAGNGGDTPNPAGLICSVSIKFSDGTALEIATDKTWQSAVAENSSLVGAKELGPCNMAPWNKASDHVAFPDSYQDYETSARILAQLGVQPDFESDANIRYIHRSDVDAEIYFVANCEDRATDAACTFRVVGKSPALWNPDTGAIRPLPEFSERDGRITVPMKFEPLQSFLVVFRKEVSGVSVQVSAKNFPKQTQIAEITGPWQVAFDPKWGGPEKPVEFAVLDDWTKRTEPGIRFYSGTAVYRKTFDASQIAGSKSKIFLDLGRLKNLARVKLNGSECGIVWCAPWRVDIAAAVKPTGNQLEIEVANLWPNRLIGDLSLPAEKRRTWTTRNPYRADSPLLESGLLGPVTLWMED